MENHFILYNSNDSIFIHNDFYLYSKRIEKMIDTSGPLSKSSSANNEFFFFRRDEIAYQSQLVANRFEKKKMNRQTEFANVFRKIVNESTWKKIALPHYRRRGTYRMCALKKQYRIILELNAAFRDYLCETPHQKNK